MKPLRRLARSAALHLQGVMVFALVGRSGTGKSFRARLVAEKNGIDIIVDDGLLIQGDSILTGHWAKKERSFLAATRRALFDTPEHAREAREALAIIRYQKVLIVGTSQRMVNRIAVALDLPRPSTVFRVDEIASRREIETALSRRRRAGEHAVPLPLVSVRRRSLSALAADMRSRLGNTASRRVSRRWPERSVITPEKVVQGGVAISEAALGQMVMHCVAEYDPRLTVEKVRVWPQGGMHGLEVGIRVPFGHTTTGGLHQLREYVLHSLERYAGMLLREVQLVVQTVGS